ncbi:MAG: putative toxin-antitoxin system toxin component, PIN family [Patescibacteria group bacterium]
MIKIVPDTNVLVGSMLGGGGPKRWVINLALEKKIALYGSSVSYAEFMDVIQREEFKPYLEKQIYTVEKLEHDYKSVITIVDTEGVYEGITITEDPDDDEYFRIAKAEGIKVIVSEDNHLRKVGRYEDIRVVTAKQFTDSYISAIAKTEHPSSN